MLCVNLPGQTADAVMLDREAIADVVLEAIEESQRRRGVAAQTHWCDAAEAAELLLAHVTFLTGESAEGEQS